MTIASLRPDRRSFILSSAGAGLAIGVGGHALAQASAGPPVRELAKGLAFPEGPVVLPDGSIALVEIKDGLVTRIAADGARSLVAKVGGGPNGAALGPDGALYVCNNGGFAWSVGPTGAPSPGNQAPDYIGGRIQRVDLKTGAVKTIYSEVGGNPLRGPNDLVFDSTGGFWFTDLGKSRPRESDRGGLYYGRIDGTPAREVVFPLTMPNGVALSPRGDRLYVAETPTNRIFSFELDGPGRLKPETRKVLIAPGGSQSFDSIKVEAGGNICAATLVRGGISVFSPDGAPVEFVPMPDTTTTNICFGGPDMRTAYITLSGTGRLVSLTWPRPGLRLAY